MVGEVCDSLKGVPDGRKGGRRFSRKFSMMNFNKSPLNGGGDAVGLGDERVSFVCVKEAQLRESVPCKCS